MWICDHERVYPELKAVLKAEYGARWNRSLKCWYVSAQSGRAVLEHLRSKKIALELSRRISLVKTSGGTLAESRAPLPDQGLRVSYIAVPVSHITIPVSYVIVKTDVEPGREQGAIQGAGARGD